MIGKPLIVVLGATAVGKTQLSLTLCKRFNGEVISADSRQIYRYMDIGTAKATQEQVHQIPHHLIDIVNPDEMLTLAEYQEQAYQTIDQLHQESKVPFLVGGTGQYITAVVEGWSIPRVPPNWALRDELEAYASTNGVDALHARLMAIDPEYAMRTHPNNIRRVIRALEVCIETDDTMTRQQQKKHPPYQIYTIGLQMERVLLYQRADSRVEQMIAHGLVDEVMQLLAMGYTRDLPSMSGLGYLEIIEHLIDNLSLEDAIQRTKFNTHNFIRRQEVWFRGHDHGIIWHNIDTNTREYVSDTVGNDLENWLERRLL